MRKVILYSLEILAILCFRKSRRTSQPKNDFANGRRYLAQGANSSIEDGAVLGNLLAALKSKDQLPQALNLYQTLRKKRGEAIVRETFAQRKDFHMNDGAEQQARDQLMLSQPGNDISCKFPSRWQCPEVQPWLYGYDAWKEVEVALQQSPFT